jgi:hypothetical protein
MGDVPKSLYELSANSKLDIIMRDNYLFGDISKESYLDNEDDVYEFRMAFNHEVIDATYTIPTNSDLKKFIYEGLVVSNNNQSFTLSNNHPNKIKDLMITRNGILQGRKED